MSGPGDAVAAVDAALAVLPRRHPDVRHAVLALSGGPDSSALALRAVVALRPHWTLTALHVDHGLQPAASAWARDVARLCEALALPLEVVRPALQRTGGGLEADARRARYAAFRARAGGATAIVLAHHRDDQAETFLLGAARGSGPRGLAAMPARRALGEGVLLRPLLDLPREALAEVCARAQVVPVADPMNADARRERAFLRETLLPAWRTRRRGLAGALARCARLSGQQQEALAWFAEREVALRAGHGGRSIDLAGFDALPLPVRAACVRAWLGAADVPLPPEARLGELLRQCTARPDATVAVAWGPVVVGRFAGRLWLDAALAPPAGDWQRHWDGRSALVLPAGAGTLAWARATASGDCGEPPAVAVRFRRGGERLVPAGAAGHRPLKALLQEGGVPPWERARLPLVEHRGELAAVPGVAETAAWRALSAARNLRLAHRPSTFEARLTLASERR